MNGDWSLMRPSVFVVHTFLDGLTIALGPSLFWLMGDAPRFTKQFPAFAGLPRYDPFMFSIRYPGWVALPCIALGLTLMAAAWGLHHHWDWARRSLASLAWIGVGLSAVLAALLLVSLIPQRGPTVLLFHGFGVLLFGILAIKLKKLRNELRSVGVQN